MRVFRSGRDICRAFYDEVLAEQLAEIRHDAMLIGEGSDVLGYDQSISRDHNWGIKAVVFVEEGPSPVLSLPDEFCGYSVKKENIVVTTADMWLQENLGLEDIRNISAAKWLAMPQQLLLQFVGGMKLGGTLGAYESARKALEWYPDDIWRWIMAAQWYFIWAEERLIPRTRDAGDIIGAQMIVHRLLRYIFQMHFLQMRQYPPYAKWFGTAFHELKEHEFFEERFETVLRSDVDGQIDIIHEMLMKLGENHNKLHLTKHVPPRICPYEVGIDGAVRPYIIINSAEYIETLKDSIADNMLRKLATVGAIDQLGNTTDVMINFSPWKGIFENGYRHELNI